MLTFISVVRDFSLYDNLFTNNSNVNVHTLYPVDNRIENLGIPQRYNQFMNSFNFEEESWFVFCHEDFLFKEDIKNKLINLPKDKIYGVIGAIFQLDYFEFDYYLEKKLLPKRSLLGRIIQRDKSGKNKKLLGHILSKPTLVDTVDCCCIIIHSSLVQNYKLRFDEELTFDLYSEALSIEAKEKHNILTHSIQADCEHWSAGNVTERYYKGLQYLNIKYPNSIYSGTCSLIGGKTLKLTKDFVDILPFLYLAQITGLTKVFHIIFLLLEKILLMLPNKK
jgi:hypothetical protein